MTRLARGNVWHLVRYVGSVRQDWRPSVARTLRRTEVERMKQFTRVSPPYQDSTCRNVGFRTRCGKVNAPGRPPSLLRPEPGPLVDSGRLGDQDGGPPALSAEEEAIFYMRLSKIWEGLMTFPMTADWNDIISGLASEKWLSLVAEGIPTNVKSMLASSQPPTLARLKLLAWADTTDAGVFAWLSAPNEKSVMKKTGSVYIGSASKYPGGLRLRRRRMLLRSSKPQDEALKHKIKRLDLDPEGVFITLFMVPFRDGPDGDVLNVRAVVILARAVLMIWLGAVDEGLKPVIRDLAPWGLDNQYAGLAGDNPLAINFHGSGGAKTGKPTTVRNKRRNLSPGEGS